jgi:AmmeMemoRadiSam system protein B
MIRESVVSGQFYPNRSQDLRKMIEDFKPKGSSKVCAKGIILPHAGYIYSGRVAVAAVSKVLAKKRIIILGPNHTGLGASFGLWPKGAWRIPFGEIKIDEELAQSILSAGSRIREDYECHLGDPSILEEHSIEVELPILYYFLGEFKFVPIACKMASLDMYREAASQIFEAVKGIKDEVLLVASTDLTHYEPDSSARKKDRSAIEAIVNLDEKELLDKIAMQNITMCGVAPVAILISCLKKLGAKKSCVELYQTSGDSSGDYSAVVGYVGMTIS